MAKTYDFDDFCQIHGNAAKERGRLPVGSFPDASKPGSPICYQRQLRQWRRSIFMSRQRCVNLCEELGDMLFQVVIQSQIAAEEGLLRSMMSQSISEKMIRRHPHVFGEGEL